jgi:hypothetical protein
MAYEPDPNFEDADQFYETLVHAHDGLTERQSRALARHLVLLLANQVGSATALRDALLLARREALSVDQ